MKVVQVPFCFAPDPMGGTEIFVSHLSRDLNRIGVHSLVAAPGSVSDRYEVNGMEVCRFGINNEIRDAGELYGAGDVIAQAEFERILDQEKPDVVHLHAWTSAVSLRLVRAAKNRNIAVVFTYHTPTVTCQRGTLQLWGASICDGEMRVKRCAACTLHGLGLPRPVAAVVAQLPPALGRSMGVLGLSGGAWTVLRYTYLMELRHRAFRQMITEVDHVVAVCNWVRDLLHLNRIDAARISLSRQGIDWPEAIGTDESFGRGRDTLRMVFVGRLDQTKGLGVILDAMRMTPDLKAALDIYGIVQGPANVTYRDAMLAKSSGDPRIVFKDPLPANEVVTTLRQYDFLVVPSVWLETGPMVVLEAFAAGIPVLGWNLGGISELVRDGIDGILLEPFATERWVEVLGRLTNDRGLCARLKAGVRPPRRSMDVAIEMKALYARLPVAARHLHQQD